MRNTQLSPGDPVRLEHRSSEQAHPVVDVCGLMKRYEGVAVVDNIDLTIESGEIFGLLGANGAGKTTTVECLQGLRRPDAGHVRVLGLDPVADRKQLRARIGSQLQEASLPDRLRVREAVALFDGDRSRRPETVLDPWGLANKANTAFADLSGGQRQRLLVVLALLNEPQVVFLDELTQGLDAAARRDVWQVVRGIREQGTTVVIVSHNADEIEALCDRAAVMRAGQVIDLGTPRELTDRHAAASVVMFTPPVSFDAGPLRCRSDIEQVDAIGDQIRFFGTSTMVAPICAAALDDLGDGPGDLLVRNPTLDEALVNLIGAAA